MKVGCQDAQWIHVGPELFSVAQNVVVGGDGQHHSMDPQVVPDPDTTHGPADALHVWDMHTIPVIPELALEIFLESPISVSSVVLCESWILFSTGFDPIEVDRIS